VCWINLGDSYAGGHTCPDEARGISITEKQQRRAHGQPIIGESFGNLSRIVPSGLKTKDLVGIPWRVAFALQADGWYLRSDIIWAKPNPMPESVTDRPTKAHEYLFLLTKSERYYYDADAIRETATCRPRPESSRNHDGTKSSVTGNHANGGTLGWNRPDDGRNRRTVWFIPTMPYAGAHFATMPEALVEPCILAGCPMGGLVLDPFVGSGTVVAVAARLGRRGIGVDLGYQGLAKERTAQRGLPFDEVLPVSLAASQ
jgi:DNA methylase